MDANVGKQTQVFGIWWRGRCLGYCGGCRCLGYGGGVGVWYIVEGVAVIVKGVGVWDIVEGYVFVIWWRGRCLGYCGGCKCLGYGGGAGVLDMVEG